MTTREIYRLAQRAAYEVRDRLGYSMDEPILIMDAAAALGLRVMFVDAPSMEGMYCHEKKVVLISRHRPAGRRAFTCAHEIGHWYFAHGTSVDELTSSLEDVESSLEERLANAFAQYILMPPTALGTIMNLRKLQSDTLSPEDCFILSNYFGVAYSALIASLYFTAGKINRSQYENLKVPPNFIRRQLTGNIETRTLVVVDEHWGKMPIDLEVGGHLMCPQDSADTNSLLSDRLLLSGRPSFVLFKADNVGCGTLQVPALQRTFELRVAKEFFSGHVSNRFQPI